MTDHLTPREQATLAKLDAERDKLRAKLAVVAQERRNLLTLARVRKHRSTQS